MKFDAHGEFELSLSGEIIVINFFHKWNLEGAEAFFSEYKKFIKQNKLQKFGVLSDLSQFEGGTPDGIEFFEVISDWASDHGQIARAQILGDYFKEYTITKIDNGKERFPAQIFSDREEAFVWLNDQGLTVY